jgi:hypothetical protein
MQQGYPLRYPSCCIDLGWFTLEVFLERLALVCLLMLSATAFIACQQSKEEIDTAKIQESIDKIKAKIQEELPTTPSQETPPSR